jgi:mono/diheme cytochrome c family protein
MKRRILSLVLLLAVATLCIAAAKGAWLQKVPPTDRDRPNPCAGQQAAVDAGRNLYREYCAKCHGENAEGRRGRPSLRSERLQHATDGDIAWIIKNGQVFHGMPSWAALPDQERWQIVTYLRSLNPPAA